LKPKKQCVDQVGDAKFIVFMNIVNDCNLVGSIEIHGKYEWCK